MNTGTDTNDENDVGYIDYDEDGIAFLPNASYHLWLTTSQDHMIKDRLEAAQLGMYAPWGLRTFSYKEAQEECANLYLEYMLGRFDPRCMGVPLDKKKKGDWVVCECTCINVPRGKEVEADIIRGFDTRISAMPFEVLEGH